MIGSAGLGNFVGIAAGSVMKRVNPKFTVVLAMLADAAAAIFAALSYGLFTLCLLGFVAGLAQCLAKLSLDSTIQRDVPERVRTSAFARSDTTLQLAWVIGGFVGIALPASPARRHDHRGGGAGRVVVVRPRQPGSAYAGTEAGRGLMS